MTEDLISEGGMWNAEKKSVEAGKSQCLWSRVTNLLKNQFFKRYAFYPMPYCLSSRIPISFL
jgi:hypothetical protein